MPKRFNTTGNCIPKRHYMVDLTSRLEAISKMVDAGQYITINRGRQYGKTTTLFALESYLADRYVCAEHGLSDADEFINIQG